MLSGSLVVQMNLVVLGPSKFQAMNVEKTSVRIDLFNIVSRQK